MTRIARHDDEGWNGVLSNPLAEGKIRAEVGPITS